MTSTWVFGELGIRSQEQTDGVTTIHYAFLQNTFFLEAFLQNTGLYKLPFFTRLHYWMENCELIAKHTTKLPSKTYHRQFIESVLTMEKIAGNLFKKNQDLYYQINTV